MHSRKIKKVFYPLERLQYRAMPGVVHMDKLRPIETLSISTRSYVLGFIDDYSAKSAL